MENALPWFLASLIFWYFYFGLECHINGPIMNQTFLTPFKCWYQELLWNLPIVGMENRLKYANGDVHLAMALPGIVHFALTNILLPLSGLILYYALH